MSRSTISTFKLFELFPDEPSARKYLEGRLWPDDPTADKNGNVWVITPAPGMYLRQFGMVL